MTNSINPFDQINYDLKSIKNELADIKNVMASSTTPEKKWFTVPEAAAKFNLAEITVYRNCQAGKIPSKKIGSRVMIPGSYVDK